MKKVLLGTLCLFMMASCSSMKVVDQNAALNAGTAALQALTISDSQIAQLCTEYMVEMDGQNTIAPTSSDYHQRLKRIMAKFKNISNLNLNYKVYQSNVVNAFASGDGSVRVYTGLMDIMNDDELFAVIGHELGHLVNKDVRDAYRAAYLVVAARYGIAAYSQTAGALSTGFLGDLGQQLATSAYSRKQETEADEASFQFCVASGVDPFAMYHALNVLIRVGGDTGQQGTLTEMFSSHPDTQKRATHIKQVAEAAGYHLNGTQTTGGKTSGVKVTGSDKSGNNNSGNNTPVKVNVKKKN
ncbi:MAG: M48 family metalloprotease [Bacteroidales bacterium]|jgi:putative metalloprotease|nr:M48 family metalloprotease [Bacteroidales bacterium]